MGGSQASAATALALAGLCVAPAALADSGGSEAQRLFDEARDLMEHGHYAEACARLERSEALDPGIGTEFNLARCYELQGRLASARAMYRRVVDETHAAGQTARETVARDLAAQLQPRVAHVAFRVSSPVPALEIRLDGAPVTGTDWAVPVEVDPGEHEVVASAPAFASWKMFVRVSHETETAVVDVPPLVPAAALAEPPSREEGLPRATAGEPRGRTQRLVAIVLGGVGLAALVPGSYFGVRAISLASQAQPLCPGNQCDPTGYSDRQGSLDAGNLSTGFFVAGGVLLAAAAVAWLTAPDGP